MKAPARPYHHGNLREELLRAAESALETGGIQSISLREISREIGVSHTSPRRHFADRQALLDALAVRGFERFEETLGREAGRSDLAFKARLTGVGRAYVAFAVKHPALLGLMFEAKHRPDAPRELVEAVGRTFAHGPAIFARGQAAGEIAPGDPALLSLVFFSALLGLITICSKGTHGGTSLDDLVVEVVGRMMLGFQPRP